MFNRQRLGLREAFKNYKGELPSSVYRKVIQTYYKKVIDAIIFDNLEYKFHRLGHIYLAKVKPKIEMWESGIKPTLPIDWKATKSHGKIIYHMNENKYGYVFRIKFNKMRFKNAMIYRFIPERWNFKRYLSSILQDPDIKIDAPLL